MKRCIRFLSAALLLASTGARADAPSSPAATGIDPTRTAYLMRCGGCHGIEGVSAAGIVPNLRAQVGTFLCTPEGRQYMLRVPNVAMSLIASNERLAAVMNFVIFDLGGSSTPAGTPAFTAGEVGAARAAPLQSTDLGATRRAVLQRAVLACAARSEAR